MNSNLKGDKFHFFLIFLTIVIPLSLSIPVLNRFTTNEDEGISLYGAIRILNGESPYRDFWHITLPGAVWTIAGAFKIFGATLLTARTLTLIIIIGEGIIIYLIGRRLTERTIYPIFASLFVFLFNIIPSINFTQHKPAVFFAILGFYLILHGKFLLSGFAISASTFFQQNTGVLSAIGIFLFLITEGFIKKTPIDTQPKNQKFKILLLFIPGYMFPLVIFLFYLYFTHSLKDAFYTLAIWPFQGYTEFNKYPYFNCENAILKNAINFNGGILQVISNFSGIASLIFIGYIPIVIFLYSLYHSIKNRNRELYLVTFGGIFLFLSSFTRPDLLHVLYTLPLFFVLFFYIYQSIPSVIAKPQGAGGNPVRLWHLLLKFISGFMTLLIFFIIFERTIAFLNVSLVPHEIIKTPRGNVRTPYHNAQILKALFEFIETNTQKDDKIFIYHWSPALYFYLNRVNPTRFDSLIPLYNTQEQLNEIIEYLKNNPPPLIIQDDYINKIINPNTPLSCSFPYVSRKKLKDDPVDRFILENYNLVQEIGNFKIFLRK